MTVKGLGKEERSSTLRRIEQDRQMIVNTQYRIYCALLNTFLTYYSSEL